MRDKYGSDSSSKSRGGNLNGKQASDDESRSSSSSETEDEGELATEQINSEIIGTLNAIRSRDPRIYDKASTFYSQLDSSERPERDKEKPLFLQDYHRQNLLSNTNGTAESCEDQGEDFKPDPSVLPYNQQQAAIKKSLLDQVTSAEKDSETSDSDEEDFLRAKPDQEPLLAPRDPQDHPHADVPDPSTADADPDKFLNELIVSRSWIPDESSRPHPFESDDDSSVDRADEFENAFNLRFEDPERANEKLLSHSRQAASKHSVRKEDPKGRKRARQAEKEQRAAEKAGREQERQRLRKLKIEEAEEKLQQFKHAAGITGLGDVPVEEWEKFLEEGFEGEKWDEEMQKRFGNVYYAVNEEAQCNGEEAGHELDGALVEKQKQRKHPKKPKWDDDIDIGDIDPAFNMDATKQQFTLSSDEDEAILPTNQNIQDDAYDPTEPAHKTTRAAKRKQKQSQHQANQDAYAERTAIESAVDRSLQNSLATTSSSLPSKKASAGQFRYRDSSPTSFGLSSKEILMAEDKQLNQLAGLKKLASFRDSEKKAKERARLVKGGKKARLRRWREDVWGKGAKDGPGFEWEDWMRSKMGAGDAGERKDSRVIARSATKHKKRAAGTGANDENLGTSRATALNVEQGGQDAAKPDSGADISKNVKKKASKRENKRKRKAAQMGTKGRDE